MNQECRTAEIVYHLYNQKKKKHTQPQAATLTTIKEMHVIS